jgi:hypothetical protein
MSQRDIEQLTKTIQSSIQMRQELAHIIQKIIKMRYTSKSCQELWHELFSTQWKNAQKLGGGEYGSVYTVKLKGLVKNPKSFSDKRPNSLETKSSLQEYLPLLPLAIKKTKGIELDEVKNSVQASSLVEVGANPHFLLLYLHMHCGQTVVPITGGGIPWNVGREKILELKKQILQLTQALSANISTKEKAIYRNNITILKETIKEIEKRTIIDPIFFNEIRLLKNQKENEYNEQYPQPKLQDAAYINDTRLINNINILYNTIKQKHQEQFKVSELLLLEKGDEGFDEWLENRSQTAEETKQLLSALFQICMACLTLVSFFKMVQNDLLLHNIMYNYVDPQVKYVYKFNGKYFTVPLYGKLMKLFDFGLSTNIYKFQQCRHPGSAATHWCVGGRDSPPHSQEAKCREEQGFPPEDPGQFKQCSVFVRDMLELFFHLKTDYTWKSKGFRNWLDMSYQHLRDITVMHIQSAMNFVQHVFDPKILHHYNLPPVITVSAEAPLNLQYQKEVFEVTNYAKYKDKINQVMQDKIWQQ